MALGKIEAKKSLGTEKADSMFAYGVGLLASFEVIRGLSVGIAPQYVLNGKSKEQTGDGDKEIDLLARIAYGYQVPNVVTVYAEVLPGFSIVLPSVGDTSKGLVLAVGAGAMIDLSRRFYANVGAGYQMGFQTQDANSFYRPTYVRVVLGTGVRFF